MHETAHVLDVIEQAQRRTPFCETCASPAAPVGRDGAIWLECVSLREDRSRLKRLLDPPFLHTRRVIVEDAAA
jgi:hypothetical protein